MLTRCLSGLSLGVLALVAVPANASAIVPAIVEDEPDLEVIYRIKQQAFQGSQLKETLFYLTDVYGPRLTGSPGYMAAAKWTIDQLTEWGISKPRLEKWGEFGRGWSYGP